MRRILRMCYIITMILSLLTLTACNSGGDEAQKVALGRYIEKVSRFPETQDMVWLNQTLDGKMQIYQQGETLKLWERQEDGSLLEIHNEGLDEFNEKYPSAWMNAVTTDEEGNIYLAQIDYEMNNEEHLPKGTNVIKINETGMTVSPLHSEEDLKYIIPLKIMVLDNEDVLILDNKGEVQRFSLETGEVIRNYGEIEGGNILLMDDQFYNLNFLEHQIDVYSIESGQIENQIACSGTLDERALLVKGNGKDLYIVSPEGIMHLAEGGNIWEEVVSGSGLSLSLPSTSLDEAIYGNQKFMVKFSTSDYATMIREYVYSETTPTNATQEINIYALEINQIVEDAVNSYQFNHPEIKINMQYGMNETSGISIDDAIKALNAELLSGNGPDLIVLDGLDSEGYREKGLLADLSDMIDEELYMPSIINSFTKEGVTYGMPLRFTVPTLWGDEQIVKQVKSIEEIANYQKTHPDIKVYHDITQSNLFEQWATLEQDKWFDEQGELNEDELIGFLEAVKNIGILSEQERGVVGYDGALEVSDNKAEVYEYDMDRMLSLLIGATINENKGDGSFKILEVDGEKVFKPNSIISINKNSQKQELAKEILAYMLEESMQLRDIGTGFPVHMGAIKAWIEGENYNAKDMQISISNNVTELNVSWGNEETVEGFYEEVQGVTKAVLGDEMLTEMVLEAAQPYFEDTMTVEEVVSSLKPKLELYMNE